MKKRTVPRPLSKSYTDKKLEKKVLRRLSIPRDREWVESLFSDDGSGKLKITAELPDEQIKRLKKLAKAVRRNRGIFTLWKIVPVTVILAGLLLFNIFFRNTLVEKGVEAALQNVFQAQVQIDGVNLSLLKGDFSFDSLTIADKDNPGKNLLETGHGRVGIDIMRILYRKLHIEEISLTDVKWNTDRADSGALPVKTESSEPEGSGTKTFSVDYKSLIESRSGDLASFTLLEGMNARITSFRNEWSENLDGETRRVNDLEKKFEELKNINVSRLDSPADVEKIIKELTELKDDTAELRKDAEDLGRQFRSDKNSLVEEAGSVASLIDSDVSSLAGSLNFGEGNFRTIASNLAEMYIRSRWNRYYDAGLKGWKFYNNIHRGDKPDKKKKGLVRASGRTVPFPSRHYPAFLADKLLLTGSDDSLGKFQLQLTNLSSDPDRTEGPLELYVNLSGGKGNFSGEGVLDLRTGSEHLFQMSLKGSELSFSWPDGIPVLEISRISSPASLEGQIQTDNDNNVQIRTDIRLNNIEIQQQNNEGFLHDAVKDLFGKNNTAGIRADITVDSGGIESVSVDTDFDRILDNSIGAYMEQLKSQATGELKKALEDYLKPTLIKRDNLLEGLDKLDLQSASQLTALGNIDSGINNKKKELEKKAASFTSGILDKAKDSIKLPGF